MAVFAAVHRRVIADSGEEFLLLRMRILPPGQLLVGGKRGSLGILVLAQVMRCSSADVVLVDLQRSFVEKPR